MFYNFVVLFFLSVRNREKFLRLSLEPVLYFFFNGGRNFYARSLEIWRELLYTYFTNSL
jgi:hypothetical protein